MIRPLIIVVNLIIVMIFKLFVGNPSAEVKAPSSVKAGEAFLVEVTVSTNGETDFMRYSMDFPAGWTVEKVETAGASFKFDKQVAKFLWSRVGEQKELKISYKVTPPADASGDFSLNNKLSHTVDNLPANIELTPLKVTVVPATGNTTASTEKTTADSTAKPSVVVTIERGVPTGEVETVFVVDLVLNKEDLTSFGKIEDSLPSGFSAKLVKADGADFKFENNVVKFSWFVLPPKHTLNVQYRVTVDPSVQGDQVISGHFSYVENETGKLYTIAPSTIKIKEKVAAKEPDQVVTKQPDQVVTKEPDQIVTKQPDQVVAKQADTTSAKEPNPVIAKTVTDPTSTASTGVTYSVQIAAMTRLVPTSYYTKTFHLSGTINTEQVGGLNKYTTGSFPTYQAAHDHRQEVRGQGVSDAFVTAYNSGKRITVQEALMITSQKWVQ
ncbi:MAG TPA: hypothetical protein VFJ43_00335 [Bacteroidia bacterium]|nr:hypothetical protein [Bacteroidia bacterium]